MINKLITFQKTAIFLAIIGLIFPIKYLSANDVIVAPDILDVTSPAPNQKVKGSVTITWRMYDDEQTVIPYSVNIYDAATCSNTNYGQINSNTYGTSSAVNSNSITWNTKNTLTSQLADGRYCLKICAAYKANTAPYTACNGRNVTIINDNRLPTINSVPSNLTIYENQAWSYQILATDADGDALTYRFILKPAFLEINSQTGYINENGLSKLPAGAETAIHTVQIAVDDNFSGSVTQQFEIVVKKYYPPQPAPPPVVVVPPATTVPTDYPTEIAFVNPTGETIFKGEENKVEWKVNDKNGVKEITLSYSKGGKEFTTIQKFTTTELPSSYNWDVGNLEDGSYFLQLTVTDKLGTTSSKLSKVFQIQNESNNIPNESVPLIINVSPQNNSEVDNARPELSGEFIPSEGAVIEPSTAEIKLNGVSIKDVCNITSAGFNCTLDENLNTGSNKVEVAVKDSDGKNAKIEWTFSVKLTSGTGEEVIQSTENDPNTMIILGREIPRNTFNIILIICCLGLLLLLIPWILYGIWSRRNTDEVITTTNTEYTSPDASAIDTNYSYYVPPYDSSTDTAPQPNVTTNYYTPENYDYTAMYPTPTVENTVVTEPATPDITVQPAATETNLVVPPTTTVDQQYNNFTYTYPTDAGENASGTINNTPTTTTSDTQYVEPKATDSN